MEDQAIFTTSWDDGHLLDAGVAELLSVHGFQGTVSCPLSNREGLPLMGRHRPRRLGGSPLTCFCVSDAVQLAPEFRI